MNGAQSIVQAAIAVIVCLGFFVVMFWAVSHGFPPATDGAQGLYILLGILSTSFSSVLQYYFQTGAKKE